MGVKLDEKLGVTSKEGHERGQAGGAIGLQEGRDMAGA